MVDESKANTSESSKQQPKVFISYSHSSEEHKERVRELTDRLIHSGIDAWLDIYDLKEGDDLNVYMEKMVHDPDISHVLMICDTEYQKKANDRKSGVGTESLIISDKIYKATKDSKFIPVIFELTETSEAPLPTFCSGRFYLDFSSFEMQNKNWERLIRLIYDQPQYVKPQLGEKPAYLDIATALPKNDLNWKLDEFKNAIQKKKYGVDIYRSAIFDECCSFADSLRIRDEIDSEKLPHKIVDDCNALIIVRDCIIDWLQMEATELPEEKLADHLIEILERFLEFNYHSDELQSYNDSYFGAHSIFLHGMFLYILAVLIKKDCFKTINILLSTSYLLPKNERSVDYSHDNFNTFRTESQIINPVLSEGTLEGGSKYNSPAAELLKRQANRNDICFNDLIEIDLLLTLKSLISKQCSWIPNTIYYKKNGVSNTLFIRSKSKRYFKKLAVILGIDSGDELRKLFNENIEFNTHVFDKFWRIDFTSRIFCINDLDTLP